MDYRLTTHAEIVLKEREIPVEFLERALAEPELILDDNDDPELEHRLRRIEEYDNRVLRVIYNKTVDPAAVITVYFDRRMKGKL
jgi:hypothetical protein